MKIDLVYLWVDGSDEKWLAKKNAALQSLGRTLSKTAVSAKRWNDHDELKYSLRSVEKFIPWINHIFIVTDEQTPKWLDLQNPKITIIDHKKIIPEKYLPTFNSSCIELFLHKIPNLSEHFLFANDDMFFGKPLTPAFFFDEKENPIVQIKERNQRNKFKKPSVKTVKNRLGQRFMHNVIFFIFQKTGKKYNVTFKHAIEPMRKSFLKENFERYEEEFLATTATTFRGSENIQRLVFSLLDDLQGRNTLVLNWRTGNRRIVYNLQKDSVFRRIFREKIWLFATVFGFVKYDCFDKLWQTIKFLKIYRPTLFTINDTPHSFADKAKFIDETFPEKSTFEL